MGALLLASGLVVTSGSAAERSAIRAKPSCHLELQFDGYRYSPTAVPAGSVQAGAPLRTNALLRCEESIVCKRAQPCAATGGRIDAILRPLRVRGIRARIALIDPRTNRFYLNAKASCRSRGFPRCLRKARLPAPHPHSGHPSTAPPPAYLVGSKANFPLAQSSYCWTTQLDENHGVGACADFLAPKYQHGLPLIVAQPGVRLRISLGFEPDSATIYALGRRFKLAASANLVWKVPGHTPSRSFLVLGATRPLGGGDAHDQTSYVARLRISR